ncbi:hypothetical protein ACQEV4_00135 [Streptomyces shenzhenensis]|uniref:hypothetical protein n=1 Tax=Streptomyces shenzhenensis TaxID=943815 RepID=UPI003D9261D7
MDFLAHFEAFDAICRQMRGHVVPAIGNEPQPVDLDALATALDAMQPSALRIPLLGTPDVVTKAADLVQAAANTCHAFSAWNRHLSRPDPDTSVSNTPRGLVEHLLGKMSARRDEFTSTAKQVLTGTN